MTKNEKVKDVSKLLDLLNEKDLSEVANDIYNRLIASGAQPSLSREFEKTSVSACVHCGAIHFIKHGKDAKGNTRYLCKECGKTFTALTDTALKGTHKDAATWKAYVENMLEGRSLAECAKRCGISIPTAHVWRHKILNALSDESFDHEYSGMLEMDEMFVRISYKGNHKKSKDFVMPRKSHHRGSDGCYPSNKEKGSVLCIVERGKGFSGVIPCRGMMNFPLLKNLFGERLSDESVVMTDGWNTYKQYFSTTNAQHIVLSPQPKTHKPTVIGPYHINNVNALHHRFRDFMKPYNGVSTKFLKNYLALFLWLENHKEADRKALVCDTISTTGTHVSSTQLRNFAPVPDFAPTPVPAA